jgi:hypothetical protein
MARPPLVSIHVHGIDVVAPRVLASARMDSNDPCRPVAIV